MDSESVQAYLARGGRIQRIGPWISGMSYSIVDMLADMESEAGEHSGRDGWQPNRRYDDNWEMEQGE